MPGPVELGRLAVAARHHLETLISGQRLDGRKASVFARLEEREPQAGEATDHPQSGRAAVDYDATVDLSLSAPYASALQQSRGLIRQVPGLPLRARQEEPPRTVTVSHGQNVSRPAGQPIRR